MQINKLRSGSKKPQISVVIPSYNSERTISACLQSVLNQKTSIPYEVIVVDSGNDKTAEIVKAQFPSVKLIKSQKRLYAGTARNAGIKRAKGEIIACLDSDCIVVIKNWFDMLLELHKKYDIIGARICNGNPENLVGWGLFLMEFSDFIKNRDRLVRWVPSYHISCRRKIFRRYGYFSNAHLGQDVLFTSKIKEKKFLSSKIQIKHVNKTDFLGVVCHSFMLGKCVALIQKQSENTRLGKILLKNRLLIPLLLFYRLFKVGLNAFTSDRNYFLFFILTSPLILINLTAWTAGFYKGAKKLNTDTSVCNACLP